MSRKPPDFELWTEVTKSVSPLRKRPASRKSMLAKQIKPLSAAPPVAASQIHVRRPLTLSPPPITGLDRRTAQKLTRGNVDIEGRLDLHARGAEMARVQLLQFLRNSYGQGLRTVLVITGKGESPYTRHTLHGVNHFDSPERQGRLRRLVPEWLHEAQFRALVSGYQPAHPKHGGGGAFYIRMRRHPVLKNELR